MTSWPPPPSSGVGIWAPMGAMVPTELLDMNFIHIYIHNITFGISLINNKETDASFPNQKPNEVNSRICKMGRVGPHSNN